ncbi:CIC_collapsed_G0007490.mRNA.1.CDS.1 [Saccharomyces cerevisiae]|nr:CIC_HP2_G0006500.mRNA.1.CDS.1 [Saccharomyces cerevisiae]CAI6421136.1 CIC_HP2_G0006500.mRNA.1.CDS.1 [Saccharomyces cerevisiae]CAI6424178.1 CIC_HP1_G0006960.mRNA.1.CDS.1 [Saccharomyces cerevisiae]CAI7181412.1 CIC_collapsed_G0007490.mRNA.1.CDS.1 [Saccharomyces cerevisiae]
MGDSNSSQEAYSDTTSTNTSRIADQNQLNLNVDLEKNQTVRKSGSLEALQNAKIHVPKHSDGSPLDYPKLNTYTFVPTTVPPYVLEAQFDKLRLQDKGTVDGNVTDDKNLPKEFKWGQFASTIGCHSAYTRDQNYNPSHKSYDGYSLSSSTSSKNAALREILGDMCSEWGGEERLEGVLHLEIGANLEFNTTEERKEWLQYIEKVKDFYYGDNKKNPESPESVHNKVYKSDWVNELNKEREKWRRLKQRKLQQWRPPLTSLLLDNQYLILGLRIFTGILSCISLALAIKIFQNSRSNNTISESKIGQQPSTIMAICVNAVAIAYIIYIAHDEFAGKPVGLRNPLSKLKLILLDLLFIIFSSANLALAFNTRFDKEWVCTSIRRSNGSTYGYPKIPRICRKQEALSAFLFVALFMWVITFSISIVRVVEKVSSITNRN